MKAHEYFGKAPSKEEISKATGVPVKALKEIVERGEGAYYSAGSRPNVSPEQWGIARLYAVLFGSKGARKADGDLVKKYDIPILTNRMKGKGATPDEIVERRKYPENYSKEVQSVIKMALFNPSGKGLSIMGSAGVRSQRNYGDYDLYEIVRVNSIDQLETRFKRIVRNLVADKKIFIGDIKLGNYEPWRVVNENAYFVGDKLYGYDAEVSRKRLTDLYKHKIISQEEYSNGMKLLKDNPDIMEWNAIKGDLRYNIVRWRPKEVLEGKKMLFDGKTTYTLRDALQSKSLFKMDFFALMSDGIFQEYSVIYDVRLRGKRLNIFPVNVELKLREDMSYFAQNGDWWKFLKRFFSLTSFLIRTNKGNKGENERVIEMLNEILNSDLGIVANLRGDIGGLMYVMESEDAGLITIERAKEEVDDFTDRLANVYSINGYLEKEPQLLNDIEKILKAKSKKPIVKTLEGMYEKLTEILNKGTKEKMDEIGLRVERK